MASSNNKFAYLKVVAIKELTNLTDYDELKKEIDILKKVWSSAISALSFNDLIRLAIQCSHNNIVCYFGTIRTDTSLWVSTVEGNTLPPHHN